MAQQNREYFMKRLQDTASQKAIPINRMTCQGIPDKDGFQLTVEAGGAITNRGLGGFFVTARPLKAPKG
jgi:hypothetical protein